MLCRKPYMVGTVPFGCGQCLPCRINRRRLWTWRMYLESLVAKSSCFVTLTYAPDQLPENGSLVPRHYQLFLKSLRRSIAPITVRYFLCGEYGDQTERPHYHACLFGIGIEYGALIQKIWSRGFTTTLPFNEKTAQYVAGYVVKKMTSKDDKRLNGRYPEFARMSLKPGIGAPSLGVISDAIHTPAGLDHLASAADVPMNLKVAGRDVPLGRYLRQKLREEVGAPEEWIQDARQRAFSTLEAEMFALCADHGVVPSPDQVKALVLAEGEGRVALMESFSRLSTKGSL